VRRAELPTNQAGTGALRRSGRLGKIQRWIVRITIQVAESMAGEILSPGEQRYLIYEHKVASKHLLRRT
jgi:hypothetical protein